MSENTRSTLHRADAALIANRVLLDREAFYSHLQREEFHKFHIPEPALQYFIPPRILELVANPANVRVARLPSSAMLNLLVIDRRKNPLSDVHAVAKFHAKFHENHEARMPAGIDQYHAYKANWLREGIIDLRDYVMLEANLMNAGHNNLLVADYNDRREYRHKGVAKSFYERLREIGKAMGFRYISGWNSDKNASFFTGSENGLGRSTLAQVVPGKRGEFLSDHMNTEPEVFGSYTIDFLYPEDKRHYIQ